MSEKNKIVEIVQKLDDGFWATYNNQTDNFPDTEEAVDAKYLILNAALTSIIGNYLLGFNPAFRAQHLEHLVQHIRNFEIQFRDFRIPE